MTGMALLLLPNSADGVQRPVERPENVLDGKHQVRLRLQVDLAALDPRAVLHSCKCRPRCVQEESMAAR